VTLSRGQYDRDLGRYFHYHQHPGRHSDDDDDDYHHSPAPIT